MENPVIARHSELLNRIVIERDTMQEMGRVEQLWMYPQAHRIMGVVCRSGRFRGKRFVYKLPQLDSLSKNNLWVNGSPTETTDEQIQRLESLMDHEVWVDGGDRLGVIIDCMFNRKTGAITRYLFVDNPLRRLVGSPMTLSPREMKGFGNGRVLVDARSLQRLQRERVSIKDTLTNVREQAREEYGQVTEEMRTAQQQAAERAEVLRQQATERAGSFREQASEQAQTWQQRLTQKAQVWGKKLGEQAQEIGEQAMELSQDFREQALELRSGEWGGVPVVPEIDEVTWIDEAGDLPPGRPRRPERLPEQYPAQDERYRQPYARETPPSTQPSRSSSPQPTGNRPINGQPTDNEQFVTRENPWGYRDESNEPAETSAGSQDWEDPPNMPPNTPLNLEPYPGQESATPSPGAPSPSTEPEQPTEPEQQARSTYLDPNFLQQISESDLEDEDPWV